MPPLVKDAGIVAGHVLLPPKLKAHLTPLGANWGAFARLRPSVTSATREILDGVARLRGGNAERKDLAASDPAAAVAAFASALHPGDRPSLHFLHVEAPHYPWRFVPSGQSYDPGPLSTLFTSTFDWSSPRSAEVGRNRHLLQVGFVDRLLGSILDRMQRTGLLDRALLVVTADHGIAFDPSHHPRDAVEATQGHIARVPLFVKRPGSPDARIDDRPAQTIDVLPTIADVVGVPAGEVDGVSLLGPADRTRRRTILARGLGRELRLPADAYPRDAALSASVAATGDPTDPHRRFRSGPFGSVVGTRVVPRDGPVTVRLHGGASVEAFDPGARSLPLRVEGTLDGHGWRLEPDAEVAIAVDGTVAGVGPIQGMHGDRASFEVLLDPSLLRRGRNDLEVLVSSGAAGGAPSWWAARPG